MHVFVTVGSTRFDGLVDAALAMHVPATLTIQYGNSHIRQPQSDIEIYSYKNDLASDYAKADLVVAHAGAGTIIEVLRAGKRLIVVPNTTLADDHQQELANALEAKGYLTVCNDLGDLENVVLRMLEASRTAVFPEFEPSRIREIMVSL